MGITGLLPFLEKASSACHLKELRGKCVAIDSYCWLHRGAFGCAERLARGEQTDAHIRYCLKYVQLLLSYNIKPILVFDGRHLPAKAATEAKRRESRENARKRGAELLRLGRIDEARSFLRRCVDITHEMALQLIQECRKRNVDCVVAPYEADAQLAFLNRADIAQYVITEDSDLVLFGCSRILFKLDLAGNGRLVESTKLHLAMGCREERYQFDKFRQMCILSGCDYLESLPGIGLAKACRFILKTEDPDIKRALAKIPAYLNMRQLSVSEEYKSEFLKAEATFKHMVVYDPVERRQKRLTEPLDEGTPEEYCCNAGEFLDEDTAFNLALGNLDPFSLRLLDNWHPDKTPEGHGAGDIKRSRHLSIWQQNRSSAGEETCEKQSLPTASITNAQKQQPFVKRSLMNAAFEEQGTKDTIADVLQAYGIEAPPEPPMKRLCPAEFPQPSSIRSIAFEYEDVNVLEAMALLERQESPKRYRNPFVVATNTAVSCREASNALLSPTKITPSNRSLLQNLSPVKRIDYSVSHSSGQDIKMASQVDNTATAVTTSRLSRFKRTNTTASCSASAGQKVISRFFCSQTSTVNSCTVNNDLSPKQDQPEATGESPTAIVRKFKSKQETQKLAAAALYLRSPEAQLKLRGDRTPEKRRTGCDYETSTIEKAFPSVEEGLVVKVDSGIVVNDEEPNASDGDGLSLSQKENDDSAMNTVVFESNETKGRKAARLSLFEHKHVTRIESEDDKGSDDLAIVLDDADDGSSEAKADNHTDNEGTKTDLKLEHGKPPFTITASSHASRKTNSKPTCRRPGLSAIRGKPSKDAAGLTQSRLSMFGFQKKSSMQLDKR
ncbi:exonuclease 1-like [Anopheles albimanus]|uniref:Exonuclease 1 n=1 Tax=Anopheles albimanus TaxID=7167 RepID=A0A182FSS4_ANOAL|nr:exonuclease 1-like [Anopheles albimanus]